MNILDNTYLGLSFLLFRSHPSPLPKGEWENMESEMVEVIDDSFDRCSYLAENRHFIDCIVNDLQPIVTGEDGLAALRVSHAIITSHRDKMVISIPPTSL
jgi:predicted dehydrogenase